MKKSLLSIFLFALLGAVSYAQELPDWENPLVVERNKEPGRATFTSYPTAEEALEGEQSPFYKSLNGTWKFHFSKNPAERPADFYEQSFDVSKWDNIQVPGNWEVEGFGIPIYVNHPYEFADARTPVTELQNGPEPPRIPRDYNPVGSYRRTFEIPQDWDGRQVFIELGAVKSAFYIWINGDKVGYSQGSKLPSEFDITSYVKTGKQNTVSLEVYRWSDASYLECQDFWRISGIERDVAIYSQPKTRIRDFEVVSTLDDSYKTGELDLFVDVKNHLSANKNITVAFEVAENQGAVIAKESLVTVPKMSEVTVNLDAAIENVKAWSAEHPNLYHITIQLIDEDGAVLEAISRKIGFRSVEIKRGQLLVNGVPVTLKGANLHEHHPKQDM
ncbi:sugar-binding domain-containing protein [Marinilabilia salmonicolor]|uniref:sugar-binding domain-containing protein n=1 Tax=Marinilabilia salmonicolor TaxID=989 RepID=UPI000A8C766E|nr:sugar-binding domain-containing protein [Marinilabilia salmonicolor]